MSITYEFLTGLVIGIAIMAGWFHDRNDPPKEIERRCQAFADQLGIDREHIVAEQTWSISITNDGIRQHHDRLGIAVDEHEEGPGWSRTTYRPKEDGSDTTYQA